MCLKTLCASRDRTLQPSLSFVIQIEQSLQKEAARAKTGFVGGKGGGQAGSLPSSGGAKGNASTGVPQSGAKQTGVEVRGEKQPPSSSSTGGKQSDSKKGASQSDEPPTDKKDDDKDSKGKTTGTIKKVVLVAIILGPIIGVICVVMLVANLVGGVLGEFGDALGYGALTGDDIQIEDYTYVSKDQEKYLKRLIKVRDEYVADGKYVDSSLIMALYHVLNRYGANIQYDDMTTKVIRKWFDYSLNDGYYDEETFKNNLYTYVFPKYIGIKLLPFIIILAILIFIIIFLGIPALKELN